MSEVLVDWTYADAGRKVVFCKRCGGTDPLTLPIDLRQFGEIIDAFNVKHAGCKSGNDKRKDDASCQ